MSDSCIKIRTTVENQEEKVAQLKADIAIATPDEKKRLAGQLTLARNQLHHQLGQLAACERSA